MTEQVALQHVNPHLCQTIGPRFFSPGVERMFLLNHSCLGVRLDANKTD